MKRIRWYMEIIPRLLRSILLSSYVSNSQTVLPIRVSNARSKVIIRKGANSKFVLNGILRIDPYFGGTEPVFITLAPESTLIIDGDMLMGNGTQIMLDRGAYLYIGGKRKESASGITERTRIMVRHNAHIGTDCIIAWGGYITDCDWHSIEGQREQADVYIGDHVWIASNVTILKGVSIGANCIVASNSLVSKGTVPASSLIGGVPAQILKNNVSWRRDLIA